MAGNALPLYSKVGDIQWGTISAANTTKDGTSGTILIFFTADATNGGRVEKVNVRHLGTNIATVMRVFINNGSTNTVAGNNILFAEKTIPANTVSETAESVVQEIPIGIALPPGYRLFATLGTGIAAGLAVAGVGGKY